MLSIILPNRIEPRVHEVIKELESYGDIEIIVSCDRYGKGKGWALREGLKEARGNWFAFLDSDMDIKPKELINLLSAGIENDIVVGKKETPKRWDRKILTFLSRLYIRFLFGIKVDTQTGIKLFNYKPEWKTNGWAFDIEILYRAKKMGKKIVEVPIKATVSDKKGVRDIWFTLIDTLKIRFFQ